MAKKSPNLVTLSALLIRQDAAAMLNANIQHLDVKKINIEHLDI
jgi:hypothetical protein